MTSKTPFFLLMLAAVVTAAATFVEASRGSAFAHEWIYGSWAFKLLWASIVVTGGIVLWQRRMWRRIPLFLLHLSFVVILAGALLTNLTGKKGVLHLREGIPTESFVAGERVCHFPFLVRLDSFSVHYYPGTEAPQDYVSQITADGQQYRISMNQIANLRGYRLCQSGYDPDGLGTILSVNYDPWGIPVTYAGYGLLALGMVLYLTIGRKPRPRSASGALMLVFFLSSLSVHAKAPSVSKQDAERIARQQVMWNNRPCPVGVVAHDFLLKVYGKRSYQGLDATQVLVSWTLSPDAWNQEPIIKVGRGKYAKIDDFIDHSGDVPRLKNVGHDAKTDEKVALVLMLQQGTLVRDLPAEAVPLSESRVSAELFYASVSWALWGMVACFLLALLSVAVRMPRLLECFLLSALFLFLLVAFFLRWYVAGHVPLSNGYETMLFLAICLTTYSLYSVGRSAFSSRVALLMAAFVLLVAHLGAKNPQVTPLMPVLHSPWLSAHVSTIMISYALLILSIVERRLLPMGVCFLAVGIFLGAIWANVSWGTYWSWDPKESWALVTLLIYSLPLHQDSLPWFRSMRNYRIYSVLGLLSLLMTYWGVNFLPGGMHSYQ